MHSILKAVIILVSVFTSQALCGKSCRQCFGTYEITNAGRIDQETARKFAHATLSICATGEEFELGAPVPSQCTTEDVRKCSVWQFPVKAWRYCGNGGSVTFNQPIRCVDGTCASSSLDMKCHTSVVCHGGCKCEECGC